MRRLNFLSNKIGPCLASSYPDTPLQRIIINVRCMQPEFRDHSHLWQIHNWVRVCKQWFDNHRNCIVSIFVILNRCKTWQRTPLCVAVFTSSSIEQIPVLYSGTMKSRTQKQYRMQTCAKLCTAPENYGGFSCQENTDNTTKTI